MGTCCKPNKSSLKQNILQNQDANNKTEVQTNIKSISHCNGSMQSKHGQQHEICHALLHSQRLSRNFYRKDCIILSKQLLGKILVRVLDDGTILSGLIIDVEAYLGGNDKASHSYNNIETEKNRSMFLDAGHCYIYKSFRGNNDCFNITSDKEGIPAATLIRAIYPLSGLQIMKKRRMQIGKKKSPKFQNLCSGPALLCQSMDLTREKFDGVDMVGNKNIYVEEILSGKIRNIVFGEKKIDESLIIATPRVNIQYAGKKSASELLRFCLKGFNNYFSCPSHKFSSKKYVMIWPDQ